VPLTPAHFPRGRASRRKKVYLGPAAFGASVILIAAAVCAAQAPSTPAVHNASDAYLKSKVLPNGLEIIVYEDHTVPLVTVDFVVKAGSYVESLDFSGLSHLDEHMFFKSNAASKNHEAYLDNIGEMGITYNGSTYEEHCEEHFTSLTAYFPTAIHYLRDAARYPLFDPEEVLTERAVVLDELDRDDANPYDQITHEMTAHLFYQYPNRKLPEGSRDIVAHATAEKLRTFYDRYYVPNNSALVIAGDVTPEEAFKQAELYFGDWPRAADPFEKYPVPENPPLQKSFAEVLQGPVQNVLIEMGWQGPSIGKDNAATYAADVFSYILRQPNSRFQKALVDSGLALAVDLGYYTQRNVGPITVFLQTTPDKVHAALAALQNEISHFGDADYFSDQELRNAKVLLGVNDLFSRERTSEFAIELGFWWSSTSVDYYRGYQQTLEGVTRADISRYLHAYILGKPHVSLALLSTEAQQRIQLKTEEVLGK
jgi:zinc protease